MTWSGGAEPRQIFGQLVSANYFDILGMRPAAGRFFLPDEDTKLGGNDVEVLSYSLWANKFGSDPHAVGKILNDWHEIAEGLAESKRKRDRFRLR